MTQIDQAFRDLLFNPTADALGTFTTQLETLSKMLPFPEMKAGLMDCFRKIRRDRRFDDVRNDETMLRLYKILGQYSENPGMKGIYVQLHATGNFNKSLKFYLQWAEELAKKNELTEFTEVLEMARKALEGTLTMPEIESGFRDMADEHFPDGRAAVLFASPDDTLDVFRDNAPGRRMKRRSSVCHLQQMAPVNTAREEAFGPRTKTQLRSEFIDVSGTFGVSIEEFRYAMLKDRLGEDVDPHRRDSGIVQVKHQVAGKLSPLSEVNADDEDEKRSRIYSPLVPTKDATRPVLALRFHDNTINAKVSLKPTDISSNFSVLSDPDPTMNLTQDRPKKTSGALSMVFDELAPMEEPKEATEDKPVQKIKKELEDTRLSGKSLRTPPTFEDDRIATSTPVAGVVDVERHFGNKPEAAPPPPTPEQVPSAANSSIDCLSDNLGRRLSLGADEIRAAIVANEAETTGILKRRRSEIIRKGDVAATTTMIKPARHYDRAWTIGC
ncbi:hypothetical protein B9Z55_001762 [Caenorhabditis nigoni]|uniref:BUB1 N-terminal domain-containing protein n=1 Tax=Caenorhabditis nigoni TaxID=1611254 RepID=A0A2G5VHH2_9PELO|nr:hypothetical protein B9Z55_001762 [Caenorhabditis nigoni]